MSQNSAEYLQKILDSIQHPFYVVDAATYQIKFANKACGFGELNEGMTCHLRTHKSSTPCVGPHICPLDRVKKTKQAVTTEHIHYDKEGNARNMDVHGDPIFDENGNVVMMVEYAFDITERKEAQGKIEQAAKEWRETFDSIEDLVSIIDKDFRIMRVNKAFANLFKMKPQEIIGKTCYELMHGSKEPLPFCPKQEVFENKKASSAEFFDSQRGLYLEVTCSPIFDNRGEVMGVVHIAKDISERKKLEKRQHLAQLGKFIAEMAHEVNNPLMIISGNAYLASMEGIQDENVKNYLRVISDESNRAKEIVQRLLKFSRPGKGEHKEVDVNVTIGGVADIVTNQFSLDNIEIKRNFMENPPLILCDEHKLEEVFMNLLNNAKEAMSGGGTITITSFLEDGSLKITFQDTGCGMTEEVMSRIFEPFFTTKIKGTGLGLSICYDIIKSCGGELKIKSEPGKGTTISLFFPIKKETNA